MQAGFLLDHGHMNSRKPVSWVEGEPEASFWTGLSLSGKKAFEVEAFRCSSCGRLEFFAKTPAGA
jgi:hypothetical protein